MIAPPRNSKTKSNGANIGARALCLLGLLLWSGACSNDLGDFASLPLPFEKSPAPKPQGPSSASISPRPRPAHLSESEAKSKAPAAITKNLQSDCDELPELTPEELAGPPYDLDLQKAARPEPSGYILLSGVSISKNTADALEKLDAAYFKKSGAHLVITSGTRDPARQAKAMYKTMQLGTDILKLYRNKPAAQEIKNAYTKFLQKGSEKTIEAIYQVLKDQMDRGVYISAHLRAGAVDVRNRDMSRARKKAFEKSVLANGSFSFIEESKPPHFHLELE